MENLVIHAENLYFGDLDLEMEGLYFNIENELDMLLENLENAGITDNSQIDIELKTLIMRATIILINYVLYMRKIISDNIMTCFCH